jgi:hypothetical protein
METTAVRPASALIVMVTYDPDKAKRTHDEPRLVDTCASLPASAIAPRGWTGQPEIDDMISLDNVMSDNLSDGRRGLRHASARVP